MNINKSKTVILAFAFMLSYGLTQAQGINFKTGDWTSVQEQAKAANKLIFIDVYTTWCGPCKWMDKNVFNSKEVGDYFNAHFINYKLDAEKGEGVAISKTYGVSSYPHFLFVDGDGKLVMRHSGLLDVEKILEFGEKAIHSEKEAFVMDSEYNAGNRTPEFMLKYLAYLKERDLPTTAILVGYLEAFDKAQWLSKENLTLINRYMHSPYNKIFEHLVEQDLPDSEYYKMGMGPIPVDIYYQALSLIIKERGSQKEINKLLAHARTRLNTNNFAYIEYRSNMLTAKRDGHWDSYTKHIITYVNTYVDSPLLLNNYAWAFYERKEITDPNALNEALGWVNRALEKSYQYVILDTKVAVLYKLGRKEDALVTAKEAVKLAEESGGNASSTLEFIEKIKAL